MTEESPWELECDNAAWRFGQQCRDLNKSNPHDLIALDRIINTLMTELWDNGFSQTEIRSAFEQALADLPRYAAGLERRSDGPY
ncbi:MAG: hypothetical protein ACREH4_12485 [Vitreimonas sp.]